MEPVVLSHSDTTIFARIIDRKPLYQSLYENTGGTYLLLLFKGERCHAFGIDIRIARRVMAGSNPCIQQNCTGPAALGSLLHFLTNAVIRLGKLDHSGCIRTDYPCKDV